MSEYNLWDDGRDLADDLDIELPAWIEACGISTPYNVAAIAQGGCASGACMPAVEYYRAAKIMAEHGDDVLDYIQDRHGELPAIRDDESWGGIAVHFLSYAVDTWAAIMADDLPDVVREHEEDATDIWLCDYCTQLAVNGDSSGIDDEWAEVCGAGLRELGNIAPNGCEARERWADCDSCGDTCETLHGFADMNETSGAE